MGDKFDKIVTDIANKYINSILFVDERAFSFSVSSPPLDKQKDLDAAAVSHAFSMANKICGFFAPKTVEDIEYCKQLVLKPDIVVLDWDIKIEQSYSKEEEDQDDDTDDRGHYSIELLKAIVADAGDEKLKVVFIYTGEVDLMGTALQISQALGEQFKRDDKEFEVYSENVHVLIRLKPESKADHIGGYRNFKVSYDDLPKVVINSFSKYVYGLMPCFAMRSLSIMRNSTAKVLKVYNAELDPEFIGHQLALKNPDDAKAYLANSFGSAITELVMDDSSINTDNWVDDWIDSRFSSETSKKQFAGSSINLSASSVKSFFADRYSSNPLRDKINSSFSSKLTSAGDKLIPVLSSIFHKEGEDESQSRYCFAALAHNKNIFSNHSSAPILTLGTIIKSPGDKDDYYLCIQQRCDTVRLDTSGLDFLFIPLYKEKRKNVIGAIALGPNDTRYIVRSSKNVKMFHFSPETDSRPVVAQTNEAGKFIFKNTEGDFEWVNELKDLFVQRIVTAFTSHLARVAVDDAEWLRMEYSNND